MLRYQDFVDQLRSGTQHGVFIDDTGSPGLVDARSPLDPRRASWVGVIVPRAEMPEVLRQFPAALDELSRTVSSKEFHFGDIYAGRREFKGLPIVLRLALFEFMAMIFSTYRFPIIVQTFDPNSLASLRPMGQLPERVGPFDLTQPRDAALFFLLIRVKWHLEQQVALGPARVFIDEGFKRNGVAIRIPKFEQVFADGIVCFAKSSEIHGIQLADFAAFCVNRTQLLLAKDTLSPLDRRLLQILSPIAWNYVSLDKHLMFDADGPGTGAGE